MAEEKILAEGTTIDVAGSADEKKARKLADAIRRLADDVDFLVSKWNGDAE